MGQQGDKPTPEEIARAKEILRQENEKPGAQQGPLSGLLGVWGLVGELLKGLPKTVIMGGLVIFLGYHAWDYYNAARRDPAETQELMAKAGNAQVEYNAQNALAGDAIAGDDTVRGAAVRAEMEKFRAEAATAKATADALRQQINGLTAAEGIKRAELEKLANEARIAKADADAQTALLMEQRKADLARTQGEARTAQAAAGFNERLFGAAQDPNAPGEQMFRTLEGSPRQAPPRTQPAARPTYVASLGATVIAPELKVRSCAYFEKRCTEVLRLTQGQRVTGIGNAGDGWVKLSVRTNDGGAVEGYVNAKFLHFDGD
jgi:hypothetical protein